MAKKFSLFLKEIKEVFKATRIKRGTYAPLSILAAASFVNILNKEVIILAIIGILVYSIGGLYNAKQDNDFGIKKNIFT